MPTLPPTSHASHWPMHAVLQHTPSTQLPLPHSVSFTHATASGFEHVPSPFALHLSGLAHEELVQHTPSTQLPEAHCDAPVQAAPAARLATHDAPLQKNPEVQSPSTTQLVRQTAPVHVYG